MTVFIKRFRTAMLASSLAICGQAFATPAWSSELPVLSPELPLSSPELHSSSSEPTATTSKPAPPAVKPATRLEETPSSRLTLAEAVGLQDQSTPARMEPTESKLVAVGPVQIANSDRVESLTRQILSNVIELQKLNTEFRIKTALTSRWRQRRVFVYGEAGAICTEICLAEQISARSQLLRSRKAARGVPNDPVETDDEPDSPDNFTASAPTAGAGRRPPRQGGRVHGRLASANELQIVGQAVAATGDLIELSLNFSQYMKLRSEGFTPAVYRQKAHAICLRLDKLILEREGAIKEQGELDSSLASLHAQEGKMLSDLRDLTMIDYLEYHAATKRFWVLQNTAFLLDFTRNGVGITSNLIGLEGNHIRHPRYAGSSGIFSAMTGALVMLQPVVGRVTGNISGMAARRLVSKELTHINAHSSDVFEADREKLVSNIQQVAATGHPTEGIEARLPLYAEQQRLMEDMKSYFASERRRAKSTLIENLSFASVVGPARVTNGVTGIVGGWRYVNDESAKEHLYRAGNISYACGQAMNILETARVQTSEELRQHRLGKQHMRTGQRFKARLASLDKLQNSLK